MELHDLPEELLRQILGCLYRPDDHEQPWDIDEQDDLLTSRLVCHKWNALAITFVFRTLELTSSEHRLQGWHAMLNSPTIRAAARRVVIYISRTDFTNEKSEEPSDDENSKFGNAISRIGSFALIDSICLRFTPECHGVENKDRYERYQSIRDRKNTLEAVFKAIKNRASKPDNSKIRSLTIENLQNMMLTLGAEEDMGIDSNFSASDSTFESWFPSDNLSSLDALDPSSQSDLASAPVETTAAIGRPYCTQQSKDIVRRLYCANPSAPVSDGVPARTLDLDSVLTRNRDVCLSSSATSCALGFYAFWSFR